MFCRHVKCPIIMPYAVGGMYQILTQIKRFFRSASVKLGKWLKGRSSTIAFPKISNWHRARVTRFILLVSPGINWPAMIALVPVTFRCLRYQDKAKKVLHLFCLFLDVIDAIHSVYWRRCIWYPTPGTQHTADTDKVFHNIRAVSASELSYLGNADHRPNLHGERLGI